ncbi:beta-ketoacyl-[acyl-carrier-protein] synthase II [Mesorhizobium sp. M1C.F.Ca.ET.193.01.1.1]|uniref:beta-ketoacyl-ACP synthase II n=1 Tax=unclassified Mesorhizobium TaxID=325217 RepID=UPI000FD5C991|nr:MULTISPECIES: beta-ketoacyl-ACP synthase II [unclassified Mesorhizobium]TGS95666.1 beta-ketoacyl-[acyl-carrier-protein] synthase II [bacterium M00.F.Ca.ET.177.01.1.1]TGQ51738.1 beta-ketoacyl-[acyl-carrier-protein] synthase II [Mesorhizobium sp. M1C.F.Ca.ET.210.01.1.1]TGQ67972.1 beta-ketoacyl-[acyl-carrier-protein] synthase II [Mesorhizobium sp. M1C.F.Ca.ET.212.01.1.1]TGR03057.1 beta-ketoacyl-[acyl-carrier-protein] synthase II [Mesorhizobium sp. M1C.F.Ca.ET.204.01.1.1]TGR23596.1 beta-ketoacy
MRRVVVTGLGLLSPFGMGVEHSWKELLSGRSAARRITEFEVDDLACKIAHIVPRGDGTNGTFNPEAVLEPKELRKIGDFILYGIAAADEALADSGWKPETHEDQCATGVLIGSGIGGIDGIAENAMILKERGPRRISPFFIPGQIINLVSGQVSIRHGLKGPNHAVVTACSTGAHAIGDAARLIMWGDADVMVAGGAEAPITRLSMAGFAACRALSTERNDTPEIASRPYDRDRDGFVMGEGAGVLVLEELEHAKARGAKIYAEVTGYGLTGDAYHITAPAEDGDGAFRCMTAALNRAKLAPADLDYINAHGTSTMADTIELGAVERLVGNAASKISMSSTKSSIGHLLGAAGAAEAIFSILAIRDNVAPATINLDNPEHETAIDLVPNKPRQRQIDVALSNSFGFGGTNASLVFQRYGG